VAARRRPPAPGYRHAAGCPRHARLALLEQPVWHKVVPKGARHRRWRPPC